MKTLIGIGHYSRTGKDTLAKKISIACMDRTFAFRVKRYSFAYKLKQQCFDLYAWAGHREPEYYETEEGARMRNVPLPGIGLTPVELWIEFGNKCREIYPQTWVRPILHEFQNDDVDLGIITDVRFPNEVELVSEYPNSMLIKTVRPGVAPRNSPSDQALLGYRGWDIVAGPTLGDLSDLAERIADWLIRGASRPWQSNAAKQNLYALEDSHCDALQ